MMQKKVDYTDEPAKQPEPDTKHKKKSYSLNAKYNVSSLSHREYPVQ